MRTQERRRAARLDSSNGPPAPHQVVTGNGAPASFIPRAHKVNTRRAVVRFLARFTFCGCAIAIVCAWIAGVEYVADQHGLAPAILIAAAAAFVAVALIWEYSREA